MAYTIIKSDGTVLTTIADGTLNTTSTSISLPGRDYSGYGRYLDSNFVWMLENFANNTPPSNPIRGQLWFNTNDNTLYVCPADGTTNPSLWIKLSVSQGNTSVSFDNITATGNILGNNITAANLLSTSTLQVTANANVGNIGATNGVFTNISGNGAALTSLPAANISGQVANALVAGTVYTNAQPNITSTGTLTSLSVSGNSNVSNINSSGAITSNSLIVNADDGLGLQLKTSNGASNIGFVTNNSNTAFAVGTPLPTLQLLANNTVVASFTNFGVNEIFENIGDFQLTGNSRRIIGDFSTGNAIDGDLDKRVLFQTATANRGTSVGAIANGNIGTGDEAQTNFAAYNSSDPDNSAFILMGVNDSNMVIGGGATGTGNSLPLTFYTDDSEKARIPVAGGLLIGTQSEYGSSNNLSKIVAGIFDSMSGIAPIPYDNGFTPTPPASLFDLDTSLVPHSTWLINFNPGGGGNISQLVSFSSTYFVNTSGNVATFTLNSTANIVLGVTGDIVLPNLLRFTAYHTDISYMGNVSVYWSAMRLM